MVVDLQREFYLRVAKGEYNNISSIFKFGRSDSIGSSEEVVWDGDGNYTFLGTAEFLNVVSTSALDVDQGASGAWNVIIYGLDEDFNEITEEVKLNGTVPVQTTQKFLRTYRALVVQGGNTSAIDGANQGDITFTSEDTTTPQAKIMAHEGQTLMAVYTVPAGKTAYVNGALFSVGEGKDCVFKGKFRNCTTDDCVFSNKFTIEMFEASQQADFKVPLAIPEKTDMVVTGKNGATTVSASASFGIILIDNEA